MYVQEHVMLNYQFTSRPQTRGNQLCKLGISYHVWLRLNKM